MGEESLGVGDRISQALTVPSLVPTSLRNGSWPLRCRNLSIPGRLRAGEADLGFIYLITVMDCRAVSRGEALRDMEVRPVNHKVRDQRIRERSDHSSIAVHRYGGKPKTVKSGDSKQLRRRAVVRYINSKRLRNSHCV